MVPPNRAAAAVFIAILAILTILVVYAAAQPTEKSGKLYISPQVRMQGPTPDAGR